MSAQPGDAGAAARLTAGAIAAIHATAAAVADLAAILAAGGGLAGCLGAIDLAANRRKTRRAAIFAGRAPSAIERTAAPVADHAAITSVGHGASRRGASAGIRLGAANVRDAAAAALIRRRALTTIEKPPAAVTEKTAIIAPRLFAGDGDARIVERPSADVAPTLQAARAASAIEHAAAVVANHPAISRGVRRAAHAVWTVGVSHHRGVDHGAVGQNDRRRRRRLNRRIVLRWRSRSCLFRGLDG